MQITEAGENQKKTWNEFTAENSPESFLQAWEWGGFQKNSGKKIWRIAIFDEGKIIAAALLLKNNTPFFGSYLYCPRGPVFEKPNPKNQTPELCEMLIAEVRKIARRENCFFLKIDPPQESSGGQISSCDLLKSFKKAPFDIQPKNTLILDLAKTEEKLLSEMKQKTRYNIRLAEKKNVRIFVSSDVEKDFPRFWKLIEETSKRNKIVSHAKGYYQAMLQNLKGEGRNNLFSRLYLAEYNGKIIAGNIVLFFGSYSVYLHGASSNEERAVMAPYLLQWKQIVDAKKLGCKSYDFWGISLDGEKENWKGITKFKTGFGGNEKRYVGAMDFVFDKAKYFAYETAKKMIRRV